MTDEQIDGLVPMPAPLGKLHHDDGYYTLTARNPKEGRVYTTSVFNDEQLTAHTRAAMAAAKAHAEQR